MLFERIQSCPIFNQHNHSWREMFTVTSGNGDLLFFYFCEKLIINKLLINVTNDVFFFV